MYANTTKQVLTSAFKLLQLNRTKYQHFLFLFLIIQNSFKNQIYFYFTHLDFHYRHNHSALWFQSGHRWNYKQNYQQYNILEKKLQLNLLGGNFFFKKFNKRRDPNKKGWRGVQQKCRKITSGRTRIWYWGILYSKSVYQAIFLVVITEKEYKANAEKLSENITVAQ